MISNEKTGLCLLNEIVDDLIPVQSETTAWNQELYKIYKIIAKELDPLNFKADSNMATYTLLNVQVEADELMQKLTALKNSSVLALTDEKLSYLNELENQLLLVENRRSTWMLTRGDGSAAIDIFNLNFTDSDKRLPRKRKKTLKRRLEQDEKLLREWGTEF